MCCDKPPLKLVSTSEVFKETKGADDVVFSHISILASDGDNMYHGTTQKKVIDEEAILKDVQVMPRENIYPQFGSQLTRATGIKPDTPSPEVYIKRSNLALYSPEHPQSIANRALNEAEIYETLKKNPHPGLGRSLGCIVADDGRVTGLALTNYPNGDLFERAADPESFGKEQRKHCMEALKEAVQHLHDLGLAHNDIRPDHVMFTDDGRPVLIEFESCCPIGTKLASAGEVGGWDDGIPTAKYEVSSVDCDKAQLEYLSAWLERKYDEKTQSKNDSKK